MRIGTSSAGKCPLKRPLNQMLSLRSTYARVKLFMVDCLEFTYNYSPPGNRIRSPPETSGIAEMENNFQLRNDTVTEGGSSEAVILFLGSDP